MLIGADVTHPAPGEDRRSIAAVVASMDQKFFRYAGRIKSQESRVEVMGDLEDLVHQLLIAFRGRHQNRSPERILFYRDGVSEGQYAEVMREEVMAVKAACRRLGNGYNPKITFCVVKKRHHARFFPTNPQNADRSGNCVAGTVVDTVITHPTEFDF
ncbi:Protein argonaute 10, partial [Dissophora ornata]